MNGILHLILATPGSSAFAFLSSAFEPVSHSNAFLLYPKKETPKEMVPSTSWDWDSKDFKFQTHKLIFAIPEIQVYMPNLIKPTPKN